MRKWKKGKQGYKKSKMSTGRENGNGKGGGGLGGKERQEGHGIQNMTQMEALYISTVYIPENTRNSHATYDGNITRGGERRHLTSHARKRGNVCGQLRE
jgi:hypothetical protein